MYCNYTGASGWSNATVISDDATLWNNDTSQNPSLQADSYETIHVVWTDTTNGEWGTDMEIMYCNYTSTSGWSNATIASDDENAWNDGNNVFPVLVLDDLHTLCLDPVPTNHPYLLARPREHYLMDQL